MNNIGDYYRGLHQKIDGYMFNHENVLTQEVIPTRLGLIVNESVRATTELMVGRLKVPESIATDTPLRTVTWYVEDEEHERQLWLPDWGPVGTIRPIIARDSPTSTLEGWRLAQNQINTRAGFTNKLERELFGEVTNLLQTIGAISVAQAQTYASAK